MQTLVVRELSVGSVIREHVRLNKETGHREYVEGEYKLSGANMEFHAAADRDSGAHFVILSAWRPSSSADLDRSREEGWQHPFEFKAGRHPVPREGRQVVDDLKLGWEQFEQQRLQNELVRAEENLFRGMGGIASSAR